jgi:hypothetical protein
MKPMIKPIHQPVRSVSPNLFVATTILPSSILPSMPAGPPWEDPALDRLYGVDFTLDHELREAGK